MHGILDDFPSVKLLLCILCAIVIFGIARAVDAVKGLTEALASFREVLEDDIAAGVQSGMTQLERQRKRDAEMEYLNQETANMERTSVSNAEAPKPFVFRISAESAALIEKLKPGGMAGWTPAEDNDTEEKS